MTTVPFDYQTLLNPVIKSLSPYVAGEQPKIDNLIKLNTNESPYPPSPKVSEVIITALRQDDNKLRCYPDPDSRALTDTIARYYGVTADEVFVGNGSDEVLAHIFKAFFDPKYPVATPSLGYSFYPVYAKFFGLSLHFVPLDENFAVRADDYRFDDNSKISGIIIANPNAPTGQAMPLDELETIIRQNRSVPVVIDEAYVDFGAESAVALIKQYPNLIVCQTTSKSRALAGMRVGYAIANAPLITAVNTVKNCFNSYPIDRLAELAAIASFEDDTYFETQRQKVIKSRESLIKGLSELGFYVVPSMANFVFVSHHKVPASILQAKLREQGVIVRHFKEPSEITNFLRISVGRDDEQARLLEILAEILV